MLINPKWIFLYNYVSYVTDSNCLSSCFYIALCPIVHAVH